MSVMCSIVLYAMQVLNLQQIGPGTDVQEITLASTKLLTENLLHWPAEKPLHLLLWRETISYWWE